MNFDVIVADPPYGFSDKLSLSDVKRGASSNYNTMSISQIKTLPIKELSSPDGAILALWVPSSLLTEGLEIMKEWGFKHKQTYIWVKTKRSAFKTFKKWINKKFSLFKSDKKILIKEVDSINLNDMLGFGMGRLFRQSHEICLIGINNNKIYKKLSNKSQRSVSLDINLKHSKKPEHLQNSLELMFPSSSMLEVFARRQRPGWTCVGNEAPMTMGEDIAVSLFKLKD